MVRTDYLLSGNIQVQGEVSNCKAHSTGLYFTLKDNDACINCVMFRSAAAGLAFSLCQGDSVIVTGNIDIYTKTGVYQLYAKKIEKNGAGALYEKYLKLKEKLSDMGMFADEYKQPIPKYAQKIGIVTAKTGAVIQDIQNVSRRRHPGVSLYLYESLVQGDQAAKNIVKGIETLDKMDLDVIIVGRGGGSIEDLWSFNEEITARAIFDAKTPIISAVGHETDWTIADFVADLRAPTPSAAAELAVPDFCSLLMDLNEKENELSLSMEHAIDIKRRTALAYADKLKAYSPESVLEKWMEALEKYRAVMGESFQGFIRSDKERLERTKQFIVNSFDTSMSNYKHKLLLYGERLDGASPLKKLLQGYSFTTDKSGKSINSIDKVKKGDLICVNVFDGEIEASVSNVKKIGRES